MCHAGPGSSGIQNITRIPLDCWSDTFFDFGFLVKARNDTFFNS